MPEAVLSFRIERTSRTRVPLKATIAEADEEKSISGKQLDRLYGSNASQQAMWSWSSLSSKSTTSSAPKSVIPTHIRVRLFILWAHGKGYGPFSLLPREILHLIFQFHSRPRWLASSFTAPEWFELDQDEVTLSNKNCRKLIKIRFLDLMLDSFLVTKFVSACTNKTREKGEACTWIYKIITTESSINLGVCAQPIKAGGSCLGRGKTPFNNPQNEWGFFGYVEYGMKTHAGRAEPYALKWPGFKNGDVVVVEISRQGELRYIVNGEDLGIAFTGINERVYGAVSFGYQGQRIEFKG